MDKIEYYDIMVFVIAFLCIVLVLFNIELKKEINDKWVKVGIGFFGAVVLSGGFYIYRTLIRDNLMTEKYTLEDYAINPKELVAV